MEAQIIITMKAGRVEISASTTDERDLIYLLEKARDAVRERSREEQNRLVQPVNGVLKPS